jgi:hypothetical protein
VVTVFLGAKAVNGKRISWGSLGFRGPGKKSLERKHICHFALWAP